MLPANQPSCDKFCATESVPGSGTHKGNGIMFACAWLVSGVAAINSQSIAFEPSGSGCS